MDVDQVCSTLAGYDFNYSCEAELQTAIASVLTSSGISHQREFQLTPRDRIDFMVEGVGVEVKIKGSLTEVVRQVHRYMQSPKIQSLVVVTVKASHRGLPRELNGKRIAVLYLNRL